MTIRPKKKQCKDTSECEIVDHSKSVHHELHGHIDQLPCSSWQLQDNINDEIDITVQPLKRRHRSPSHCSRSNRLKHGILRNKNDIPLLKKPKKDLSSNQQILRLPLRSTNINARVPPTKLPNAIVREEGNETNNSEDEYEVTSNFEDTKLEVWFAKELKDKRKFIIKLMKEDGACLFRAVAEQIFGDQEMHNIVRNNCVDHMDKNADFFKQYITEDFEQYLRRKRLSDTHGNHIEIQAISEIYNRPVEVYRYETQPINTFHLNYTTENAPIRLSYHGNIHYNAVIDPDNATIGVGLGLPGHQPGMADKELMDSAINHSEKTQIEETMLKDKLRETDWELTQEAIEEQAARDSYLQWLKDEGSRAHSNTTASGSSYSCSNQRVPYASGGGGGACGDQDYRNAKETSETMATNHTSAGAAASGICISSSSMAAPSLLMNNTFGTAVGDWGDDDVMARVLAASQQEYFDSYKSQTATD